VVGLGVLLAGWHRLGSSGSWTATSALVVLILGSQDPGSVTAYTGLTALGAGIGLASLQQPHPPTEDEWRRRAGWRGRIRSGRPRSLALRARR
jgi:hypothetical protein